MDEEGCDSPSSDTLLECHTTTTCTAGDGEGVSGTLAPVSVPLGVVSGSSIGRSDAECNTIVSGGEDKQFPLHLFDPDDESKWGKLVSWTVFFSWEISRRSLCMHS